MHKIILQSPQYIVPFNERARDLRILNKPLWLNQRDILAPYVQHEVELPQGARLPQITEPCLVYRDNLYFDEEYIKEFIGEAKKRNRPCRAAFSTKDAAFTEHCLPLSTSYTQTGDLYLADLWYYPNGPQPSAEPLVIDMEARELGYYHIPTYMASEKGDLVYKVPLRCLISIDSWVHVFIADSVFGMFGRAARELKRFDQDPLYKLSVLAAGLYEGRQVLGCSKLVQVGRNCVIDPSAVVHGPTVIGDNVTIGAGVVIDNCIIGDNVNISHGNQLLLSVVGDGAFLPFQASLFMTTLMEHSMVAQLTCLQMCVVGRNSFVGAGNIFTDFNLLSADIKARDGAGALKPSNRPVLGSCVGHNVRIGSGMIIYPARTIESDVVLVASKERRVIDKDIRYEDSDHHQLAAADLHRRLYPRHGETSFESW
jgi:carbonic anhydrase/acetyltransferase-like protein (isoleucine patch superfamily)